MILIFLKIMIFRTTVKVFAKSVTILKSTSVYVCFRGISRLPSAFVFLR